MQNVYKLPTAPRDVGGLQWQALALGLVILTGINVAATQYMAWALGYQPALGAPWFVAGGHAFYAPHHWAGWFLEYEKLNVPGVRRILWIGLAIIVVGSLLAVLAAGLVMYLRTRKLQAGTEHLHGSARWAKRADIEAMGLISQGEGVYVGGWVDPSTRRTHYLRHNGPEHVLAFAPTRSGKGVGLVLPTLLSWPASTVVYDIKGENYALTAGWRAQQAGTRVLRFSPVEMGQGVRINPLAEIRLGTPRDVSDAQNIAYMLTHPGGDTSEHDHWVDSATSLLTGVILYACYQALAEGRTASLPQVAQVLTRPGHSFSETLNEMLISPQDIDYRHGWRTPSGKATQVHPVVAEKAQEMLDKEEKELSGILSTAKVFLQLYSDPIVASNIDASDFRVDELVNGSTPASLYLVVPPSDKDRLRPLTRLIYTLIVNRLTESMRFEGGRSVQTNKHRLLLLIDEFPTLGNMEVLVNAMGYTAGYGIKYYLIVQDEVQLRNVYGENELVFSATHVRIAYAPNDPDTAELLSNMTGRQTVMKAGFNYSGNRLSPMLGQVSTSVEQIERPLLTPDECARLPGPKKDAAGNIVEPGDMLVFVTGFPPIYGRQILYFQDPVFRARAQLPAPQQGPLPAPPSTTPAPSQSDAAPADDDEHVSIMDLPIAAPPADVAGDDVHEIMRARADDLAGPAPMDAFEPIPGLESFDAFDDFMPPEHLTDARQTPAVDHPAGQPLNGDAMPDRQAGFGFAEDGFDEQQPDEPAPRPPRAAPTTIVKPLEDGATPLELAGLEPVAVRRVRPPKPQGPITTTTAP